MNKAVIAYAVAGVSLIGALAYSEYSRKELKKSMDNFSRNVKVDVDDPYIKDIVDMAVERKLDYKIDKACKDAVTSVTYDITKEAKKAVTEAYTDVKADVKKELKKQVGEVNIEGIRQEVIDEAKVTAAAKFKNDLDTVLAGYNADLENVRTIYNSIAQSVQSTQQKPTITLGV